MTNKTTDMNQIDYLLQSIFVSNETRFCDKFINNVMNNNNVLYFLRNKLHYMHHITSL